MPIVTVMEIRFPESIVGVILLRVSLPIWARSLKSIPLESEAMFTGVNEMGCIWVAGAG